MELKPCPFCGGEAKVIHNPEQWGYEPDYFSIACASCGASTPKQHAYIGNLSDPRTARKLAVELWNKRAPLDNHLRGELRSIANDMDANEVCPKCHARGKHFCPYSSADIHAFYSQSPEPYIPIDEIMADICKLYRDEIETIIGDGDPPDLPPPGNRSAAAHQQLRQQVAPDINTPTDTTSTFGHNPPLK